MRRLPLTFTCFIFIFFCIPVFPQVSKDATSSKSSAEESDFIKPEEYRQRRAAFMAKMDSGSVAVFRATDPVKRNRDVYYKYRQNSNFLYLTGCHEPYSTLVLLREGIRVDSLPDIKEILFVLNRTKTWRGENLGVEGAKEILGFGDTSNSMALVNERLWDLLPGILQSVHVLYYTPSLPDIIFDPVSDRKFVTAREVAKGIEEKYPGLAVKNPNSIIGDLRSVKSPFELVLIRKAVDATAEGCIDAIRKCKPEMYEYQLQAIIEYAFARNGCESVGFQPIIGSGPNSVLIHYDSNQRKMKSGDLVVMDIGAEYHGYSADITRTIPVNGKFTPAQKEIYELVLRARDLALADIRPGAMIGSAARLASSYIGEGLQKLGIIKDTSELAKYYPHQLNHFIGLDVHDSGWMGMLEPGMVFAVEPGVYIPDSSQCDKKYWGIGVRIEDDVVITEDGYNVLSDDIPSEVAEIEKMMKKRQDRK